MPPALHDEVCEWLGKARVDFYSAQVLAAASPPALGVTCFLCQQASEKSLKAFLT
jgi:HEPN domain-containing protein